MRRVVIFVLLSVVLASCGNRTKFYISDIDADTTTIKIEPFYKDIYVLDTIGLAEKYGMFYYIYSERVLNLQRLSDIELFKRDEGIVALYHDVDSVYASYDDIEEKLNVAFKYLHHYFPEIEIPRVLFHVSGLNQSIVVTDGVLSASIDQYLGSDYKPYQSVAYGYEIPFMNRRQLPIDMMNGWLTSSMVQYESGDRLLDQMIYQGKIMYLLHVLFPKEDMCDILGYTKEQYKWCDRYEKEVWGYIMDNRELFSSDWKVGTKYMSPAPFTNGLSHESPGRIGYYIGYRIVESYINNNETATLPQMMSQTDSQLFLQQAAYRP